MERLTKALKTLGILLFVLVMIALVANWMFTWTTDAQLRRQWAAIQATDAPTTLADLARPPIPAEENAATYLQRIEKDMKAIDKATEKLRSTSEYSGVLMPAEHQKTVRAVLAAHPEVLPMLQRAAACPDYDPGLDYANPPANISNRLMETVPIQRSAARVLYCQASLLVAEGKRDEAVHAAVEGLALARLFQRTPTLLGLLNCIAVRGQAIRSAEEALQTGPVSADARAALEAELALHKPLDDFTWAMESERVCGAPFFDDPNLHRNAWLFSRGFWNQQESAVLDLYTQILAVSGQPGAYQKITRMPASKPVLVALLLPAVQAAYQAAVRSQAEVRSLRVLNALQQHAEPKNGDAANLADLGLPPETLIDPYTDAPLVVRHTPQGWLVYALGSNLQDDGGKVNDSSASDVGVAPAPEEPAPAEKAGQPLPNP